MNGSLLAIVVATLFSPPPTPKGAPPVVAVPFDYETHSIYGCVRDSTLSPDGKRLLIGGQFGFARGGWALWDLQTGKELVSVPMAKRKAACVAISPDGKYVAVGGNAGELRVFDAATGKSLATMEGHRAYLLQVAYTPGGKYLLSLGDDNMLRLWSVGKYRPAATFRFTSPVSDRNGWKEYPEEEHEKAPITVTYPDLVERAHYFAVSPDGKSVAVATGTRQVKILEVPSGKILGTYRTNLGKGVASVAYSPDGGTLAVGGGQEEGVIQLWDTKAKILLRTLRGHEWSTLRMAFSPDGKYLLSGSTDDGARLWEVATGKQIGQPTKEGRAVAMGFVPGGETFFVASEDKPVRFFQTRTCKPVSPIREKE